ncbi:MAG: polysaccharide deacetylase family protein [Bacteroidetes bacterium]|nr:polysaccharide deacetylase family protein [Bacteroidota bacterium]
MKNIFLFLFACSLFTIGCQSTGNDQSKKKSDSTSVTKSDDTINKMTDTSKVATLAEMLAKAQVPVLCYHHIREPKPGQSETFKSYSVSPSQFADQMKALKDSGYESILPNQLYDYLVYNRPLPPKPVMLTFDDTDEEQFTIGAKEMEKNGFKGVFFIMTISINRPRYMSKEQIKELADKGNAVESHTWDHHMVTKYQGEDWNTQFVKPRKTIEDITGKTALYFAYPFGLWNQAAIPELKKAGFKMAFILSTKRDSTEPLYTIRRMIVPGQWSTTGMIKAMKQTFKLQ